jgi:hypothetical protein
MHFLPILVFVSLVKASAVCAFGGPRRCFRFLLDCVTVSEDHWTWTTRTGEWFEDAEIEAIGEGELLLKHRHGMVHLAIDALSEKSRHLLYHTEKWGEYLGELSEQGKEAEFSLGNRAHAT